jgi:TolB protein
MMKYRKIKNAVLIALLIVGGLSAVFVGARAQVRVRQEKKTVMTSTIAFVSTRHDPTANLFASQIYLMNGDGTNVRRITNNKYADNFPTLSPDGSRIVFDSNRLRTEAEPINTSHLFLMNTDGTGQTLLARGASPTWSPDGKKIAFHASASGTGQPTKPYPGAVTIDGDLFVMNVNGILKKAALPKNITNSPEAIDEDPDWSPNGQKIVFTSHLVADDKLDSVTAEIYIIKADGKGKRERLTNNAEEERAPQWSPDGKRIAYMCRKGGSDFEICVMNADGTGQRQLTDNTAGDLTCSWSPDGQKIVFHRQPAREAGEARGIPKYQLWTINSDGTGEMKLTDTPGINGFPNWGEVRVPSEKR